MIEVPESKGAYLLIVSVKQTQRLVIGQLGRYTFIRDFTGTSEAPAAMAAFELASAVILPPLASPTGTSTICSASPRLSRYGMPSPIANWSRSGLKCFSIRGGFKPRSRASVHRIIAAAGRRICFIRNSTLRFGGSRRRSGEVFEPSIRPQQLTLATSSGA